MAVEELIERLVKAGWSVVIMPRVNEVGALSAIVTFLPARRDRDGILQIAADEGVMVQAGLRMENHLARVFETFHQKYVVEAHLTIEQPH
jgi:uncharacterized membrane protein YagU involved in acid resistance